LLAFIIAIAKSQTWVGDYTAQPGCSTTQCCCLTGKIKVTRYSLGILKLDSAIVGQCGNATGYSGSSPYPNGFQSYLMIGSDRVEVTLSLDSSFATTVTSNKPACNGKAVKSGTIKQHMNVSIPLAALVLLQLMMNVVKV
jgi:hypothetical protein